jgi:hypothetical protein
MFETIISGDATVAVNLSQVASARLGTPDEDLAYNTHTLTEVILVNGSKYLIDQDNEFNYDFLAKVFGWNWQEYYGVK